MCKFVVYPREGKEIKGTLRLDFWVSKGKHHEY